MTLNIFLQLTKSSIKLTSAVMSFFSRTAGIRLLPLKEWIGYWQDSLIAKVNCSKNELFPRRNLTKLLQMSRRANKIQ